MSITAVMMIIWSG